MTADDPAAGSARYRKRIAAPPCRHSVRWAAPPAGNCGIRAHRADRPVHLHRGPGLPLHRRGSATCGPGREGPVPYWPPPFPLPARGRGLSIHRGVATTPVWCRPCAADTGTVLDPYRPLHLDFFRHWEECRMAVDLAGGWIKQGFFVRGTAGDNIGGLHDPDAHTFVPAGVDIAGIVDGHFSVGRMQAAHMLVGQAVLAAHKDFPQGPGRLAHGTDPLK